MRRRIQEAVGLAEFLTQEGYKAEILLQIAKHLGNQTSRKRESLQFLQRSFEMTRSLKSYKDRLHLLKELNKEFSKAQQWEQIEILTRILRRETTEQRRSKS